MVCWTPSSASFFLRLEFARRVERDLDKGRRAVYAPPPLFGCLAAIPMAASFEPRLIHRLLKIIFAVAIATASGSAAFAEAAAPYERTIRLADTPRSQTQRQEPAKTCDKPQRLVYRRVVARKPETRCELVAENATQEQNRNQIVTLPVEAADK